MLVAAAALLLGLASPLAAPAHVPVPAVIGASGAQYELALCYPELVALNRGSSVTTFDTALASRLGPRALLGSMQALSSVQLAEFVSENPTVLRDLIAHPPKPTTVDSWWTALTPGARASLEVGAPALIGNLEGVPFAERDLANRAALAGSITQLQASVSTAGRGEAENARRQIAVLNKVEAALGSSKSKPVRSLLTFDTTSGVRAAIALGDLQTADYVSILVPGMYMNVNDTIGPWTDTAAYMYDDQTSFENVFGEHKSVATVAWIGYQTPDITNVFGLDLAEEGANYLANAVNGIKSLRPDNEPYVSIIAHSYGATAALMALERNTMSVDALGMVGSPGSASKSVSDLAVTAGRVWVGEADWDPVVHSAFFGSDPGSAAYGAKKMSVAGTTDPITGESLRASVGHNDYLEPGTESLRNMALIGIDKGQFVTDGSATDQKKTLALAGK
jgi:hypothetical protein